MNISVGEKVFTRNFAGLKELTEVKNIFIDTTEYEFVKIRTKNSQLSVTPDHVMVANEKFLHAKKLKKGMMLMNEEIENIEF